MRERLPKPPSLPESRSLTPEQAERRRVVGERARLMQERGVKVPPSGIFGGKPKAKP